MVWLYCNLLISSPINRHLFWCFACKNNAAVSLLSCIIYASICLYARDFLFFDVSILVLTLLCCVSQGADPHSLHFPNSCVTCLASGLSQREAVVGEQGERGREVRVLSWSRSDSVTSAPPAVTAQVHPASGFCSEAPTNSCSFGASLVCLSGLGWWWVPEWLVPGCLPVHYLTSQQFQSPSNQFLRLNSFCLNIWNILCFPVKLYL